MLWGFYNGFLGLYRGLCMGFISVLYKGPPVCPQAILISTVPVNIKRVLLVDLVSALKASMVIESGRYGSTSRMVSSFDSLINPMIFCTSQVAASCSTIFSHSFRRNLFWESGGLQALCFAKATSPCCSATSTDSSCIPICPYKKTWDGFREKTKKHISRNKDRDIPYKPP